MSRVHLAALALSFALLPACPAGAAAPQPGPPLTIAPAAAAALLRCTGPLRSTARRRVGRPVLLVHGTTSNAERVAATPLVPSEPPLAAYTR